MAWPTDEEFDKKVVGQKYNKLTIQSINRIEYKDIKNSKIKKKTRYYNCLCECGNTTVVRFDSIPTTQSCGCAKFNPRKKADLTGRKFGYLTVASLDRVDTVTSRNGIDYDRTFYICDCDCGNQSIVLSQSLTSGNTKSCGCLRSKLLIAKSEDISGRKFARLTAVSKEEGIGNYWTCTCECGNESIVKADALRSGTTRSCGCLQREQSAKTALKIARDYRLSKGQDPDKPMQAEREIERAKFVSLRKEIFERDSYTCACCSVVGSKLNVHHIETWAFSPELRFEKSNLVTLCVSCHKSVHKGNFNIQPDEITSILLQGYTKVIADYQDKEGLTYDLF